MIAVKGQIRIAPHPSKAVFQAHGIQLAPIARYLGVCRRHLSGVLSGRRNPSQDLDHRIKKLASQLEQELGANRGRMSPTFRPYAESKWIIKRLTSQPPAIKTQTSSDRAEFSTSF